MGGEPPCTPAEFSPRVGFMGGGAVSRTENPVNVRQSYHIIDRLDVGGMAEVYRARAVAMKGFEKEVAIKRVLPSLTRNRRFVSMFLDEARLSMKLSHPNIVQVFDVGRSDNSYYLVMEFVRGHNVRQIFQKTAERVKGMPLELATFALTEILKALAYAHEKVDEDGELLHIVHRDVSPPNVLVSNAGDVKLVDFGLAKAATQITHTDPGVVKGKFSYLSPEACTGRTVDHRADIFAAGIMLWELLANRRLFVGKSDMETVEQVRECKVPPLSQINPAVDAEYQAILGKALAADPSKRYTSAREFGDALTSYLFAHGLKVTNYDLANWMKELMEGRGADGDDRIAALLQEEILNLSVIGLVSEDQLSSGARALDTSALALSAGSIDIDDLFRPEDLQRIDPDDTAALRAHDGPADLATALEGSTREWQAREVEAAQAAEAALADGADAAPAEARPWIRWVVTAVIAAALAAGLFAVTQM